MTDLATLPLTSDDAAPVNPFLAYREHFEQRRLDFLGRPIDETAPKATIYNTNTDAATLAALENNDASTRAWLDARKDDKGEPTGIYVPPVVHDREATPKEQAWLDAHPQYAIKEGEGRDYSFVPFPSKASQEPANMTTKTEHETRHMSDQPIPGPKPAISGGKTAITQHITKLTLTSDKFGSGESVFQVITFDKTGSHTNQFKESDPVFSAAVAKLMPLDQIQRGARYTVDGKVTWKDVDGWCTATHLEFKEGSTMEQVKASVLDDEFPRDENGEPADDLPWGDDTLKRGTFFARYEKEVWSPRNCPKDRAEAIRKSVLVREYGTDSLRGFNKPVDELLSRLTVAVEGEYPLAMAYFNGDPKTSAKPPESTSAAIPVQDTPSKPQEPPAKPQETASKAPSVAGQILGMSEAGFSMNFFWYNADGEERQFTMRAPTWRQGLAEVGEFEAGLRALGFMPKVEYLKKAGQQVAPAAVVNGSSTPSASTGGDKGKSPCSLIKVGTSFEGGKTQLQFECDGFEIPFRFTKGKGDMVRLLSKVKQVSGAPITEADLEVGKKLIGSWLVSWEKVEREGKTRFNVVAVEPAA